jgi:hypothetical protein
MFPKLLKEILAFFVNQNVGCMKRILYKSSFTKYYQGDQSKHATGGALARMEDTRNTSRSIILIKGPIFGKDEI